MKKFLALVNLFVVFSAQPVFSKVVEYEIFIDTKTVNFSGRSRMAMAISNQIPGPVLRFQEGDLFRAKVHNRMDVPTSIHWHGLLLPNYQDGVPFLTTPSIMPGQTHTFEFPARHSGTYWYHSHTMLQEQRGVYGAIVIDPKDEISYEDREYTLVLSDWTDEDPHEVLRTLKRGSHYYALKKGAMPSLWDAYKKKSLSHLFLMSLFAMPPMDISDVGYDAFLINGQRRIDLDADPGDTVKLRLVNAGASSYFFFEFAGGPMEVVAADGVDVEPFETNRILMAIAETYDVLVTIPDEGAYEFRATAHDASGHASAFLGQGAPHYAPTIPEPNLYTMVYETPERPLPPYKMLQARESTALPEEADVKKVHLKLTGDMERYVWSFNGKTLRESDKIRVKKGQRVRFVLENKTMMHHPLHLHGHFFRMINEHGAFSPLKHTVDVRPFHTQEIEFEANEEGDWFFHCHILYHMKAGMTRIISYDGFEPAPDVVREHQMMGYPLERDHYYFWGEASILSHMTFGEIVYSGTRNRFMADWEAEWDGDRSESYEYDFTYERYMHRFLKPFVGISPSEEETVGIAGLRSPLPLNLDGEVRVDTEGDFRLTLGKHLQIIDRLELFGHAEFNSDGESEGEIGAAWTLTKMFSLTLQTHSEFGSGAGITVRF